MAPSNYRVRRLLDGPIISPGTDERMGDNIQGPSLIRAPDWLPNRLGRYYLYFADHKGGYIRLAYADELAGPWTVHAPGSLQLAQSGFPTTPIPATAEALANLEVRRAGAGVGAAPAVTPGIPSALEDATLPHIASPDAHVDDAGRRIVLYYHGLAEFGIQRSRVAVSADGVNFTAVGGPIGPAYLRVFDHAGWKYALAMPGVVMRSPDGFARFERGPSLFNPRQRHSAVRKHGDTLEVFWTQAGDAPERIYLSSIELHGDWMSWRASEPVELMRPERPWEGVEHPPAPSYRSAISIPVNQLRDPAIFEEDGRAYLLYAVAGEHGIALAELLD